MMLLDWMMKEDYSKLNERAVHLVSCVIGRTNLPRKVENQEEEDVCM